jgi:aminopeptidase YwaD
MARRTSLFSLAAVLFLGALALGQMTPWLQWTFLSQNIMDEIVGESSGENAWNAIMETGGYDKDRPASEYGPASMFHETKFYLDKVKEYGLSGAALERFPGGTTWDGIKGELWETQPIRQKLASYRDMAAMLATGSASADVTAELVWVGSGRKEDLQGKDLNDKIAVTDGSVGSLSTTGAVGVIAMNSPRPLFDPLQLPWASVGGGRGRGAGADAAPPSVKFAFQMPPREGDYLKRRLLAGQKITVRAQVVSESQPYDIQDVTWHIPGTDPSAGEVVLSAHLYEGYVKQGGNDDISGCAALMETGRVLNTLIKENRIPPPRRTIRFIIGPEFSGTGPWVKAHKDIMDKTLCNINLDMVGEWLSKNQAFFCMIRTTFGNAHFINDVMENYYRYVGEGNRERIQNRSNFYPVPRRIVAPTGADEPFYYSIETHYGASDHEVFNDWGVRVPGIMMIAWPDRWYHTSGDHVDKSDPTQMKRVVAIAAAGAYTVASADDNMAVRIAGEITSNATQRIGHQLLRGLEELNRITAETLAKAPETLGEAYKTGRAYIIASVINEKDTSSTVSQLAVDKKAVGDYVLAMQKSIDDIGRVHLSTLEAHMRAIARKHNTAPVVLQITDLEKQAAKVVPKTTAKVKENSYQGWREYLPSAGGGFGPGAGGPPSAAQAVDNPRVKALADARAKYPVKGRLDTNELQLLINGQHSALEIKYLLDAQGQAKNDLQDVLNYLEQLKAVGLVEK